MLSLDAKHRLADRLGQMLARTLRGALLAATQVLPRNGRDHVRSVAVTDFAAALRTIDVAGQTLRLEWWALLTGQTLQWLEPETFAWLDTEVRDGEVLWDVGANVGLYSLWCAKRHARARVVAFEPNALTYPVLVRHVIANGVADRVQALPLALSDPPMRATAFRLNTCFAGMAANQLAVDGAPPMWGGREAARYAVLAASADELVAVAGLAQPDHLKLDVDGIEPLILRGASSVLARVRSVLVEVEEMHIRHHADGAEAILRPLREAGLVEDETFRSKGSRRNRLFVRPQP